MNSKKPFLDWLNEKYSLVWKTLIMERFPNSDEKSVHKNSISLILLSVTLFSLLPILCVFFEGIELHKIAINSLRTYSTIIYAFNLILVVIFFFGLNHYKKQENTEPEQHQRKFIKEKYPEFKISNAIYVSKKLIKQFLKYILLFWGIALLFYAILIYSLWNSPDVKSESHLNTTFGKHSFSVRVHNFVKTVDTLSNLNSSYHDLSHCFIDSLNFSHSRLKWHSSDSMYIKRYLDSVETRYQSRSKRYLDSLNLITSRCLLSYQNAHRIDLVESNTSDSVWDDDIAYYDTLLHRDKDITWHFLAHSYKDTISHCKDGTNITYLPEVKMEIRGKVHGRGYYVSDFFGILLNNLGAMMLLFAFFILKDKSLEVIDKNGNIVNPEVEYNDEQHTVKDSKDFIDFKCKIYWFFSFYTLISLCFLVYFLNMYNQGYNHLQWASQSIIEPAYRLWKFLDGFIAAIAYAVFFARFETHQFKTPIRILFVFYAYAAIQCTFGLFDLNLFGNEKFINVFVPGILIFFKTIFFIFLLYILESNRLFGYFLITTKWHDRMDEFFAKHKSPRIP